MDHEHPNDLMDINYSNLTPIQQFYSGTNILITGGTGFVGRILLEKLLRSCCGISKIYLLVRSKKGYDAEKRRDELLNHIIFEKLKKEHPNFRDKIILVEGNCALPGLGLGEDSKTLLAKEINIIFHAAATVNFAEHLKEAVTTNIRSTRELLSLAHQMPNLKAIMHVSTAFSNCINEVTEEKIYPAAMDAKMLMLMAERMPEDVLTDLTPTILGKFPNTYTFTKQIAEDVIRRDGRDLPIGIFRPSIIVSTYKEPIEGWINNMYGVTGIFANTSLGIIRTYHSDTEYSANLVPVDMCVNCLIAAAWEIGTSFEEDRKGADILEIPVYNYDNNNDKPLNWGDFFRMCKRYVVQYPSNLAIWYYSFHIMKVFAVHQLFMFLLHIIPAAIYDLVTLLMGKPGRMLKIYTRIHKVYDIISYFSARSWTFKSENVQRLLSRMSDKDKSIFFFDFNKMDWNDFLRTYVIGVRVYLLKDPLSTLPEAKKKWRWFYLAHQMVKAVLVFIFIWILWTLISLKVK